MSGVLLWKLVRSPWTWIALLSLALGLSQALYRHERSKVAASVAACNNATLQARNAALDEASTRYRAIIASQAEAIERMGLEAKKAAANARQWRDRYEQAKKTPACQAWAESAVQCPVD